MFLVVSEQDGYVNLGEGKERNSDFVFSQQRSVLLKLENDWTDLVNFSPEFAFVKVQGRKMRKINFGFSQIQITIGD
uniref:SFRICE_019220 n=1 Tax=Spodoptera frugiperda TaxID=7108 RepID=A0A2H1WQE9_SPOFR